jgi:hypothetical protein
MKTNPSTMTLRQIEDLIQNLRRRRGEEAGALSPDENELLKPTLNHPTSIFTTRPTTLSKSRNVFQMLTLL